MTYCRTELIRNGDYMQKFTIYKCDITGEEIPEDWGWYGGINDDVHISDSGMELLLEDWIKRKGNSGCGYPVILHYLIERLCKRIKPDRYIPKALKQKVLSKFKHQCFNCGSTEKLEIDHIRPVSKGGLNEFGNLQVLCKSCNARKKDKFNG